MKKLAVLVIVFMLSFSVKVSGQTPKYKWICEPVKNNVKTCYYGLEQSEPLKIKRTYYRANNTIVKVVQDSYEVYHKVESLTYIYNNKGKLYSNKDGNASRIKLTYKRVFADNIFCSSNCTKYQGKEVKKYDKYGNGSQITKYNSKNEKLEVINASYYKKDVVKTKEFKKYSKNIVVEKKFYKYNKKGKLRSNKDGVSTREVRKYKVVNKKASLSYLQKGKYNSKGKLSIYYKRTY